MELVYYYSPSVDEGKHRNYKDQLTEMLKKVYRRHDIQYRVLNTTEIDKAKHYGRFSSSGTAKKLKQRTGYKVSNIFKTNSGRLVLFTTIAVVEGNTPQYYAKGFNECKRFLTKLLEGGKNYLDSLIDVSKKGVKVTTEERLYERFKKQAPFDGNWSREVEVGNKASKQFLKKNGEVGPSNRTKIQQRKLDSLRRNLTTLNIDALCRVGKSEVWIFEIKEELSHKAIGQAMTYSMLYKKEHPGTEVHPGIICRHIKVPHFIACLNMGIDVFSV